MGNYIGYLTGALEAIGLIWYTASGTLFFGEMMTEVFGSDRSMEPFYWILMYGSSVIICTHGGVAFWRLNLVLAVVSTLIIVMYILGSLPFVNFSKNSHPRWFVGGMDSFLEHISSVLWFYIGIEYVNNGTKDCHTPMTSVPTGYMSGMLTLIVTGISVMFVSMSLDSWDDLRDDLQPLNTGFSRAFSCGSRVAAALSLPATYATNFGFIFAFGRILYSLGQANILPSILGRRLISSSTPDIALMIGSLIGFSFCCLFRYATFPKPDLFELCGLASCLSYCALLGSFIVFSTQFSHLTRTFRSVFGIVGAICAMLIFCLIWISIAAFRPTQVSLYYFLGLFVLMNCHYYFFVRHHQYFCSEEQEILFKTYVAKCK